MKRCPKCGSYDTRTAYENYVGRGIVNVGRAALSLGGGLLGEMIHPIAGHKAAESIWENTNPGELKTYKCNRCGHEF